MVLANHSQYFVHSQFGSFCQIKLHLRKVDCFRGIKIIAFLGEKTRKQVTRDIRDFSSVQNMEEKSDKWRVQQGLCT